MRKKSLPKAVIFDRDETLNFDPGYINDPDHFHLKPGVLEGLALLRQSGYILGVATNQAGLAKNKITEKQLDAVHGKMDRIFREAGITIDGLFVCPHRDEDECDCRKPKPGLMKRAINELRLDPSRTWVVGDRHRDLAAGESLGMPGILLPGKEAETIPVPRNLVYRAENFTEVVAKILETDFDRELSSKIFTDINAPEFAGFLNGLRDDETTTVTTNGVFDLLHPGHLQYLRSASRLGDVFILGLNSDESVKKIKGPSRPLNSELDRAIVLANLDFIDAIVIFSEDTPETLLSLIKPDIHVKGGDYRVEDLPEAEVVQLHGGRVFILPFRKGYSTTSIIEKMNS